MKTKFKVQSPSPASYSCPYEDGVVVLNWAGSGQARLGGQLIDTIDLEVDSEGVPVDPEQAEGFRRGYLKAEEQSPQEEKRPQRSSRARGLAITEESDGEQ